MKNKLCASLVLGALAVGSLSACGNHKAAAHPVSSATLQADKQEAAKLIAKCVPTDPTAQIQLATSLASKDGRTKFGDCVDIPKDQRTAFEGAVLGAVEKGKLSTKDGRDVFFSTTLPNIIVQYQGKK